jgi:hypothetical protein
MLGSARLHPYPQAEDPTRIARLFSTVVLTLLASVGSQVADAGAIVVALGASPAGGYPPLSAFGILPIAGVGDETITKFNVPAFSYAGQSWTRLGVVSNGYLVVGGGTNADVASANSSLPSASAPANMLAPFWTDLNPDLGGAVRIGILTDGLDQRTVTDREGMSNADGPALNSFQVWIGLSGDASPAADVTFAYGSVGGGNNGLLTTGAQDSSRTVGDTYYFSGTGALPGVDTQLRVTTRDLPVSVPEASTVALLGVAAVGLGPARRGRQD